MQIDLQNPAARFSGSWILGFMAAYALRFLFFAEVKWDLEE